MSPWLLLRPRKKNIFLVKLCVFSSLVHIFLCFGLFFVYKDSLPQLTLQVHASAHKDDVIIRLLPLSAKKPNVKAAQKIAVQKKQSIKKQPKTQLAKLTKKSLSSTKTASSVSVKKTQKKSVEVKKSEVKKIVSIEKKEPEIKTVEKKEEVVQPVIEQKVEEQQVSIKEVPQEVHEENVRYVTHKELQGIELEQAVQQALQAVWSPPLGVDPTLVSEVQVTIGWDGSLLEKNIIKPTNIVIYDVAVQEALDEITFPRAVWGKEIKIAFKP